MFHMQRQRRLPEEHARFYSAEISLALNFLHDKGKKSIGYNSNSKHLLQNDCKSEKEMFMLSRFLNLMSEPLLYL